MRNNPNATVTTGPNDLPRIGVDDVSQKIGELIVNVVPIVAVSLGNAEPTA